MKLSKMLLTFVSIGSLSAQGPTLSVSNPAWNGVEIQFVTKLEPPGLELQGGVTGDLDRAYHVILDSSHKRYFGYDVLLEPRGDSQTVQLKFAPLSLTPGRAKQFAVDSGWTLVSPPNFPVLPAVRIGETIALDLLVNPATGQKIVDYVTLKRGGLRSVAATGMPHDFSMADVGLNFDRPHVLVNGKLAGAAEDFRGSIEGPAVWLYLTGHGRFVISLAPNAALGFQKAGVAAAHTLTFRDGSAEYRVECASRIASGSGLFNVYVFHDAAWRPKGEDANAQFLLGAAEKAEWLLRKP